MYQNRFADAEIGGVIYHLLFTGEAMFQLTPEGQNFDYKALGDRILSETADGLKAVRSAAHVLSEQGELARRNMGFDPGQIFQADGAIMPFELFPLRKAVIDAMTFGCIREVQNESQKETDIGLAKLSKKKEEIS